jgi:ubiquinone biosynthesis protein
MTRYGTEISSQLGIEVRPEDIDLTGVKASLGVDTELASLTYRELQERRELIRRRMEQYRPA